MQKMQEDANVSPISWRSIWRLMGLTLIGILLLCLFACIPFFPLIMNSIAENSSYSSSPIWLPVVVVATLFVLGLFESVPLIYAFWLSPIVGAVAGSVGVLLGGVIVYFAITHYYSLKWADMAAPLSTVFLLLCLWSGLLLLLTGLVARMRSLYGAARPAAIVVYLIAGCTSSFFLLRQLPEPSPSFSHIYPLLVIKDLNAILPELTAAYMYVLLSIFPGFILFWLFLPLRRVVRAISATLIEVMGKRALYIGIIVFLPLLILFGITANEETSNQLQSQAFPASVPVTTSCADCLPLYFMMDVDDVSSASDEIST